MSFTKIKILKYGDVIKITENDKSAWFRVEKPTPRVNDYFLRLIKSTNPLGAFKDYYSDQSSINSTRYTIIDKEKNPEYFL